MTDIASELRAQFNPDYDRPTQTVRVECLTLERAAAEIERLRGLPSDGSIPSTRVRVGFLHPVFTTDQQSE